MTGLAKTEVLENCDEVAQESYRAIMADYGVSFAALVDALGLMLGGKDLTDPDLTLSLRPWITEARRLDALRRRRRYA